MPLPGPVQGDIRKAPRESYARAKSTVSSQYRKLRGMEVRGEEPKPEPKKRSRKAEKPEEE